MTRTYLFDKEVRSTIRSVLRRPSIEAHHDRRALIDLLKANFADWVPLARLRELVDEQWDTKKPKPLGPI
jgi:hypothetical protein